MEYLAIIAINLLAYCRTWYFGLIVDDIRHAEEIKSGYLKNINFIEHIRRRFYGVGTLFGKDINIRDEHIFSTVLHTVICILIYKAFGSNQVSFWASMLYAVNPANNQTAVWLNGRRYVVNIIIVLLMLTNHWFIPLYFATPLFQVSAIFAPVAVGMWWLVPIMGLFAGQRIINLYRERQAKIPYEMRKEYGFKRLVVIVKTFGFYFWKMLIPGTVLFYYQTLYYWGMTDEGNKDAYRLGRDFFLGVVALLICAVALAWLDNHRMVLAFMVLSILQWSNIATATQTLADRYMSLPNVFMMFFLSFFLSSFPYYTHLMVIIVTAYFMLTQRYLRQYQSIQDFYDYQIYHDPSNVSARAFKISDAMLNKDWIGSFAQATEGLKYRPNDFKLLYQASLSCWQLNHSNKKATLEFLDKAEANIYQSDKRLPELVKKLREHVESSKG